MHLNFERTEVTTGLGQRCTEDVTGDTTTSLAPPGPTWHQMLHIAPQLASSINTGPSLWVWGLAHFWRCDLLYLVDDLALCLSPSLVWHDIISDSVLYIMVRVTLKYKILLPLKMEMKKVVNWIIRHNILSEKPQLPYQTWQNLTELEDLISPRWCTHQYISASIRLG